MIPIGWAERGPAKKNESTVAAPTIIRTLSLMHMFEPPFRLFFVDCLMYNSIQSIFKLSTPNLLCSLCHSMGDKQI